MTRVSGRIMEIPKSLIFRGGFVGLCIGAAHVIGLLLLTLLCEVLSDDAVPGDLSPMDGAAILAYFGSLPTSYILGDCLGLKGYLSDWTFVVMMPVVNGLLLGCLAGWFAAFFLRHVEPLEPPAIPGKNSS